MLAEAHRQVAQLDLEGAAVVAADGGRWPGRSAPSSASLDQAEQRLAGRARRARSRQCRPTTCSRARPIMRTKASLTSTTRSSSVPQHHRVDAAVEDGAVLLLLRLQRGQRRLALGDVAADGQHVRRAGVADRQVAQFDVETAAVLAHATRSPSSLPARASAARIHLDAAARWPRRRVGRRHDWPIDLVAREAEQAREGLVDVDDADVGVPQRQRVGAAVEDHPVLLLARAQGVQRRLVLGDVAREGQDVVAPVDHHRLQAHLVPVQAAVAVAALPFEGRAAAEPGQRDVLAAPRSAVYGSTPELMSASGQAAQLVVAVAVGLAGLGVDVEHRAAVPVVDEDRIFGGLEDGAVAGFGALQRLAGGEALDLGGGAHREDLQHRLDALELQQRPARGDRDHAQRRAVERQQRMAGIGLHALRLRIASSGKRCVQMRPGRRESAGRSTVSQGVPATA